MQPRCQQQSCDLRSRNQIELPRGRDNRRRLAELRPQAHIVVVDAGTVGNNASGRNSGFAIDVPHNIGSSLEELRQAAHYQALLTAGMTDLERLVAQHRIDCQWRRAGKYHCAVSPAAAAAAGA